MLTIKELLIPGFKKVIEAHDVDTGLHCYIAVHNTDLGPALGGLRILPYTSKEEALDDVLKLAKAMTYKAAIAECGLGGGKSVILADPATQKNTRLLHSFAAVLDSLKGEYIVAEDSGSTVEDMKIIREKTPYVAALPFPTSSGDPSRFTAWGIFRAIQAIAQHLWKSPQLNDKKILIQGLGSVGLKLADLFFWEGAHLIVTEIHPEKIELCVSRYGAEQVPLDRMTEVECDFFVPCALGGVITAANVDKWKCKVIAGSANNQLADAALADRLMERGIIYAPDFIINAGGLINAAAEFDSRGYNPARARRKVDKIYDIISEITRRSKKEKRSPNQIALEMAQLNLLNGVGERTAPISFL